MKKPVMQYFPMLYPKPNLVEEPQPKVNLDTSLVTVPMENTSEAIRVDDQESKTETQTQNICESILSNNSSKIESEVVSHMEEPEVKIYLDNILATINKIEATTIFQQE